MSLTKPMRNFQKLHSRFCIKQIRHYRLAIKGRFFVLFIHVCMPPLTLPECRQSFAIDIFISLTEKNGQKMSRKMSKAKMPRFFLSKAFLNNLFWSFT